MNITSSKAIFAVDSGPINLIQDIMKYIIAPKTRSNYIVNNMKFLLWLYDDDILREEILHD